MTDNTIYCSICGDDMDKEYTYTIKSCNHTFHYECLLKTFVYNVNEKKCPYCRSDVELLPVVNGLKQLYKGIHDIDNNKEYDTKYCEHILLKGKRKGEPCNKKCKLGYYKCKKHAT